MSPEEQLTAVIKKQIAILGPEIVLMKVKKVPGLLVSADGTVEEIDGDPQQLLQQLIALFQELSVPLVRRTLKQANVQSGTVVS